MCVSFDRTKRSSVVSPHGTNQPHCSCVSERADDDVSPTHTRTHTDARRPVNVDPQTRAQVRGAAHVRADLWPDWPEQLSGELSWTDPNTCLLFVHHQLLSDHKTAQWALTRKEKEDWPFPFNTSVSMWNIECINNNVRFCILIIWNTLSRTQFLHYVRQHCNQTK